MNIEIHRLVVHGPLLFGLLACIHGLAGCGHHVKQAGSEPLVTRLDQLDKENTEQKKQLKQMSMRITDMENLVLKQKNELKKLKVALATTPKTLVPMPVETQPPASGWQEPPVAVAQAHKEPDGQDEEPRPLLKLYGTTSAPDPFPAGGGSLKPSSLLADASALGEFVPLKLETVGGSLPEVEEAVGDDPGAGAQPPVDPYEQGVIKYQAKEWSNAILYFDISLKHDPTGSKVMNALFLKAESLYQMKKYLDAIGQFELVLERYPGSKRAADARLRIGRCYEKLGDKSKAKSIYQQIVFEYPDSKQAGKAGKLLQALK